MRFEILSHFIGRKVFWYSIPLSKDYVNVEKNLWSVICTNAQGWLMQYTLKYYKQIIKHLYEQKISLKCKIFVYREITS